MEQDLINQISLIFKKSINFRRLILILLFLSIVIWGISLILSKTISLSILSLGPYEQMNAFYWIALIIPIIIIFIVKYKKYLIFICLLLFLFVIVTFTYLLPYGPASPDSFVVASMAKLIFNFGTKDFTYLYADAYPLSFIFNGAIISCLNISVAQFIRYNPIFICMLIIFGAIIVIKSLSKRFCESRDFVESAIVFTVLVTVIFAFSLSLRIDLVPQSFGIILFLFFIGAYLRDDRNFKRISYIVFFAITITHLITSIFTILICIVITLAFKKPINQIILPLLIFFFWIIYQSIHQLNFGINFLKNTMELEMDITSILGKTTGFVFEEEKLQLFILFRRTFIILLIIITLISIISLITYNKKILYYLIIFYFSLSPLFVFILLQSTSFINRFLEMSTPLIAITIGFGIASFVHLLKEKNTYKQFNFKIKLKSIFYIFFIVLIIFTSYFAIITAHQSTSSIGFTYPEILGTRHLISHDDRVIFAYKPLGIEYPDYYSIASRETEGLERGIDEMKGFYGDIFITQKWLNWQKIHGSNKLMQGEIWIQNHKYADKVYNNGLARIYIKFS